MTLPHRRHLVALLVLLGTAMLAASVNAVPPYTQPKHIPISGDWIPSSPGNKPGLYNTETGTFFLCTEAGGIAQLNCPAYEVPLPHTIRLPLIGRWSAGDTVDRPALYEPSTGKLLLFRFSDCLPDACDGYGGLTLDDTRELGVRSAQAVGGDWDGDGIDTVALIVPESTQGFQERPAFARFYLPDHRTVLKNLLLKIDVRHAQVIAGHWPGTNTSGDSLGFFHAQHRTLLLYDGWLTTPLRSVVRSDDAAMAFSTGWTAGLNNGLGLFMPRSPDCSCHFADYQVIPEVGATTTLPVTTPHLDSRFPDDPGGPGGPGDPEL